MTDIASRKEGEVRGFRVATSAWLAQMFFLSRWAMLSVGISILAVIALLILGFALDMAYAILAMMVLFLVLPMIVAFLFFVNGMKPINSLNMSRHSVAENEKGLSIEIFAREGELSEVQVGEHERVSRLIEIPVELLGRKITGFGGLWVEVKGDRGVEWLLLKPDPKKSIKE